MTGGLNPRMAAGARRFWRFLEVALGAAAEPKQPPGLKNEYLCPELARHRAVLESVVQHSLAMALGAPLEVVLKAIAENCVALTGATYGAVEVWENGEFPGTIVGAGRSGHPPIASLLAIPIVAGPNVVGRICVTDKVGAGEFSTEDMHILRVFAAQAGAAIKHANPTRLTAKTEALHHLCQLDPGPPLHQN